MRVSDYLELAIITIVLAVCISLSFGLTATTYKRVMEESSDSRQDKNTTNIELTADTVVEEGLTREQIVLMVEVQDYHMPQPNEFSIIDTSTNKVYYTVELGSKIREDMVACSSMVRDKLNSLGANANSRYVIEFKEAGTYSNYNKDTYAIIKIK